MATKSKMFRVAVEGATASDGRTIEKKWIQEMAAGYNRETYGARVNLEHIRGYDPKSPFKAYGDVLRVEARDVDIQLNGKTEKRLALYAEIDPTDELVGFTKARQKIYTSIEVAPNFAGTGKAGLVGLAVTDSPASLATDILSFAATGSDGAAKALKDDIDRRKQDPANAFSAMAETTIEFEAETAPEKGLLSSIADSLAKLASFRGEPKPDPVPAAPPAGAASGVADLAAAFTDGLTRLTERLEANRTADQAAFTALKTQVEGLATKLDTTPAPTKDRQFTTGGADRVLADC